MEWKVLIRHSSGNKRTKQRNCSWDRRKRNCESEYSNTRAVRGEGKDKKGGKRIDLDLETEKNGFKYSYANHVQ